ncbi:MAG TPA: hypothetical protein V6C90_04700 [Coleofasciculaceae cyanobacterium]|jgi:hypothetical protein
MAKIFTSTVSSLNKPNYIQESYDSLKILEEFVSPECLSQELTLLICQILSYFKLA